MSGKKECKKSLEAFLDSCGLSVDDGKARTVSVDKREFLKRFQTNLIQAGLSPSDLVDKIRSYFADNPVRFENSLITCDNQADSENQVTLWPSRQNSVACFLLGIPQLQNDFLSLLLETLYERVLAEENAGSILYGCIQAIKWQDSISNAMVLKKKLFEFLEDFPVQHQKQLIQAFPDLMFNEEAQTKCAQHLCDLYESRPELSSCILEALSAIRVPNEMVIDVRKSVLSSIPNLDIAQLCPVLDFVLRNLPDGDAPILINLLRSSDAVHLKPKLIDGLDMSSENATFDEDLQRFMEKLRIGVMTQKALGECWLKMIELNNSGVQLKHLDILFLLVCFRQLPQRHVEQTMRQVVKEECLSESLMKDVLTKHEQLLKRHLSNIIDICEMLLRSAVISVHEFASFTYRQLFLCYDAHAQTDVIVSLLTHAGSGSPSELQNSLDCIETLCLEHTSVTSPYGFMLQSLVDQIPRLSLGQARKMFRSLATLAYVTDDSESGLRDTLRIAARKRLVNPNLKYKCVGVVATVSVLEAMASKKNETLCLEEARGCLKQALDASRFFPACAALLFDELSLAVPQLDDELVKWIHELAVNEFHQSYVIAANKTGQGSSSMTSFDQSSCSDLHINIQSLCIQQESASRNGMPIDAMCPLFRLLRTCELQCFSSNLRGISALLFAKTMPDDLDQFSFQAAPDKDNLLKTLFHTINWNRELLNCATKDFDKELKAQLTKILRRHIALVELAGSWLPYVPEFVPPRVGFMDDTGAQDMHVKSAVKGKGAPRGRKRKVADEDDDKSQQIKAPPPVPATSFRNHLRTLDITYMYLVEDSFSPKELAFVLQELLLQLESSLALDEPQKTSFLVTAVKKDQSAVRRAPIEIIHFVVDLVPKLTILIENLANKLQDPDLSNDDLSSCDDTGCLRLCFSIVNSLLSWRGFNEPRHSKVLRDALNLIALRVGNTQFRTQCDLVEFHKRVFNYFVELSPSITDLHTAAAFVRLLLTVLDKTASNADANKQRLLGVAEEFLRKDWPRIGLENRVVSKCAQTILTVYIEESEDRLKRIAYLVSDVMPELSENPRSSTFPLIAKETLPLCFKTVAQYFVKSVKACCTRSTPLEQWTQIASSLKQLLDIIKISATNTNASCGLKTACDVLDVFLKHGIPVLESKFKTHNNEVLILVRTLQHSTRVMQHTCSHFKMSEQVALGRQVPVARRLLEIFIFRMKALFNKFGCGDALKMGQLKMRNLKGEEVFQREDEDENPPDDDDDAGNCQPEEDGDGEEDEEQGVYNLTDESAEF